MRENIIFRDGPIEAGRGELNVSSICSAGRVQVGRVNKRRVEGLIRASLQVVQTF